MVSGFGRDEFGRFLFGLADVGNDLLLKKVPAIYRDLDRFHDFVLTRFLKAIADEYNDVFLESVVNFLDLINPRLIRLDLIDFLASNYGIKTDEEEDEFFRRSELLNLYQWLIRKGEDKGYKIKSVVSGLTTRIFRLDRPGCGLGIDDEFITDDKERFVALFDTIPADVLRADFFTTDEIDLWPAKWQMLQVESGIFRELCRSNYLLIRVFVDENFNSKRLLKLINIRVNDVKAFHVRLKWEVIVETDVDWIITSDGELGGIAQYFAVWGYYYDEHDYSERVDFSIKSDGEVNIV